MGFVAEDLIDWYWSFGCHRQGNFELSPTWLASLYQNAAVLRVCRSGEQQTKISVGVWGPSQSGKSTLISGLCDQKTAADGSGGALDWGTPVRFSSKEDVPENVIVFNPHNLGSDASGCVSRFYQADSVDDPAAPVTIELLTRSQLMHALSSGYSSECQFKAAWTPESLDSLLSRVKSQSRSIDRGAFEALFELAEVVERLIHGGDDRFEPLRRAGMDVRSMLFAHRGLLGDPAAVQSLASELLWDLHQPIEDIFHALLKARASLPTGTIRCSMEVASLLVNIESYKTYLGNVAADRPTAGAAKIVRAIDGLTSQPTARGVRITVGAGGMFASPAEFGLFQGLVGELAIPLRREAIVGEGERRFFATADLVDFPGVPNEDRNADVNLIDLQQFESEGPRGGDPTLLTKVLKRGKVTSLVVGHGQTMRLDAFMMLARAGRYSPRPGRLHQGITSWWRSFDPTYDVNDSHAGRPPLPIFFNLTFFGDIVNKVAQGAASGGMQPLVQMIEQLDPLISPQVCTLLITTYKQFSEGRILLEDQNARKAIKQIEEDPSFSQRLIQPESRESLQRMMDQEDGGVGYLFGVLANSLQPTQRLNQLGRRRSAVLRETAALIDECVPGSGNDQLKRDLNKLRDAIQASIEVHAQNAQVLDPVARTSLLLRRMLDMEVENLDPIPPPGSDRNTCVRYVGEQLQKWVQRERRASDLKMESPVLRRIVGVLADAVAVQEVAGWIHAELPQQRTLDECKEFRVSFAAMLSRKMLQPEAFLRPPLDHGANGAVAKLVQGWADAEASGTASFRDSPHYAAVISPIEERLEDLANGRMVNRPDQPGDQEVAQISAAMSTAL